MTIASSENLDWDVRSNAEENFEGRGDGENGYPLECVEDNDDLSDFPNSANESAESSAFALVPAKKTGANEVFNKKVIIRRLETFSSRFKWTVILSPLDFVRPTSDSGRNI